MSENERIEKKAQIKILYYLFDHCCNSEIPETGRKAIRSLIARINKDLDENFDIENSPEYHDRNFYSPG
jgi:hypothetical protein